MAPMAATSSPTHHLAVFNIGRLVAPLDSSQLQAFMDGLDTAFSDFNAEGDMGDAEVWEQQMPQIFLVREIRKDGGGFGKFRGGSGIHSLAALRLGAV